MKVLIVDNKSARRDAMRKWLEHKVESVRAEPALPVDSQEQPDLLLLHVGSEQGRNSIVQILDAFRNQMPVIGYSGGAIPDLVMELDPGNLVIYNGRPSGSTFDEDFKRSIQNVIEVLSVSPKPDRDVLNRSVNGISPTLEGKLKVLLNVVQGKPAASGLTVEEEKAVKDAAFEERINDYEAANDKTEDLKKTTIENLSALFWP